MVLQNQLEIVERHINNMALQKRHYYGKALSLIRKIEEVIGYDKKTRLIKDGSSEELLDTFENSSFAIANVLAGRDKTAEKIRKGIEQYVGFDEKTGLVYNKIGLSKHEDKKVLPGEKTIFLANNSLMSILYYLTGDKKKSKELKEKIDGVIGTFNFNLGDKKYETYKHELNKDIFYPFNNILIGINNLIHNEKKGAGKLVKNIEELCFDEKIGLLKGEPESKLYFTLDNALFSAYLAISGKEKEAENLVKTIETKVGFDEETKLIHRGILGSIGLIAPNDHKSIGYVDKGLKKSHQIKDILTYTNSNLAISYLCLAGLFPK